MELPTKGLTVSFRAKTLVLFSALLLSRCSQNPEKMKAWLVQHPEVILEVLSANSEKVAEIAQTGGRKIAAKNQPKEQSIEEQLKNPAKPTISADRAVLGDRKAPIVLVEYSDFQCPYCGRGYQTVQELKKKYGNKLLFVFKHLPLPFHPLAMPAAKRFEAIALQSPEKAYKYHDLVFSEQPRLSKEQEKFLDEAAKKAGANMARMKKDMESDLVKQRIEIDTAEARTMGILGTPGFILNGVKLKGALPIASFENVLQRKPASN